MVFVEEMLKKKEEGKRLLKEIICFCEENAWREI